jgi:Tfp pilus assembly protein PilN
LKREINLLPERYRNIRQRNRLKRLKTAGMIMMVISIIASVYIPLFIINKLSDESLTVKKQVTSMKDISEYRIMRQELEKDVIRRQKIIHFLQSKGNEWSKIISEIGQKVPEGMELISINFTNDGGLKISGQAQNYNLVAQFLVNLQNIDIISEVEPASINQQENGLYGFEIKCNMVNGSDKNEAK